MPGLAPPQQAVRALRYLLYADAFGWTPADVDALPVSVEPWLLPLHALVQEVRSEHSR